MAMCRSCKTNSFTGYPDMENEWGFICDKCYDEREAYKVNDKLLRKDSFEDTNRPDRDAKASRRTS